MIFKKTKYFLCCFLVIILTAICVPTFYSTSIFTPSADQSDKFEPETNENEKPTTQINKTFNNAFSLFTYANHILENGKGYDIDNYCKINAGVGNIKLDVKFFYNYKKNLDKKLETYVMTSDLFGFANNKFITYLENDITHSAYTDVLVERKEDFTQNIFDFSDSEFVIEPYPDKYTERYFKVLEVLPFNVNKNNSIQNYFRNDGKYYYFELNLKQSAISPHFLDCYTKKIGAETYNFNFMKLEGVCSMATGEFKHIKLTLGMKIPMNKFGIKVLLDGTMTNVLTVKKMNEQVEFEYPQILKELAEKQAEKESQEKSAN